MSSPNRSPITCGLPSNQSSVPPDYASQAPIKVPQQPTCNAAPAFGYPYYGQPVYAPVPVSTRAYLSGAALGWSVAGIVVLSVAFWPAALALSIPLIVVANGKYRAAGIVGMVISSIMLAFTLLLVGIVWATAPTPGAPLGTSAALSTVHVQMIGQ